MSNILEVQEFFIEGDNQEKSHVLLHISEPTSPQERERGYFFALIEVNNGHPEQIQQLQEAIDKIENIYYSPQEKTKNLLERTLQGVNRQSHYLLQYKGSEINCIVGTVANGDITLAYHGDPMAILFYQGKEHIESTVIIDSENLPNASNEQLFSEIIEGQINPGDYIYLGTTHVEDHFTTDRIGKLVESRTVKQSTAHIQKVLTDLDSNYSFGGILFHLTDKSDTPMTGVLPKNTGDSSEQSLNRMVESAKSTEETLSPPFLGNVGKKIKNLWQNKKNNDIEQIKTEPEAEKKNDSDVETNYRVREKKTNESALGRLLIILGRGLVLLLGGVLQALKGIIFTIIKFFRTIFYIITNYHNSRRRVIDDWKAGIHNKKKFIQSMPMFSKIVLVLTLVLAVTFLSSLAYLRQKEARDAKTLQYKNLIQAIIDKKDAAEASLVYDEKSKAVELIKEAGNLLNTVPQDQKTEKDQYLELQKMLSAVSEKLRNIKIIKPELVINITDTKADAKTNEIVKIGSSLIAYGPDDNSIYIINTVTKKITQKNHDSIKNLNKSAVPAEEDKVVFLTKDNTIAEYNIKDDNLSTKTIAFPASKTTITDIGIYNRKIYSVDTANKQIYKHNSTQMGYDKGSAWVKSGNTDLEDAVSIAVDGDVYVLKQNGTIKKYYTGAEQPFGIGGLDPVLEKPTIIWTESASDKIIILEPTHKRVVVLDKNGKFVAQYTADEWQNPTGMTVADNGKTVYILDNNKIYKVGL